MGLTAADFLTEALELEEKGHVTASDLPSITPFENGTPRHHTRLFSREDINLTFLTGERFIPVWSAKSFSDSVMEWAKENEIEEIVFLSGIPMGHGPEDHRVFYVATNDYQDKRLKDVDIPAMSGGFLEGVTANIISRGIDSPLSVGVLLTPIHPPTQDVEASLRLVGAFEDVYGIEVDTSPLEEYAKELEEYYSQLAQHLNSMNEQSMRRELPEDRAYM